MAADAYLKAAAGDLQKAAMAVKSSMDEERSQFKAFEKEANKVIDGNKREIRSTLSAINNAEDPGQVTALTNHARELQQEIDQKKRETEEFRSRLSHDLSAKEGTMQDLTSEAKSLQNKAGDPALK